MRIIATARSFVVTVAFASAPLVACSGNTLGDSAATSSVAQGDTPGHEQGAAAMPQSTAGTFGNGSSAAALSTTSDAASEPDGEADGASSEGDAGDDCVPELDAGPAVDGHHVDVFQGFYSGYASFVEGSSRACGKRSNRGL